MRVFWVRSRHRGDPDRRARRAIANSNERRRMQSINAGFQSLHDLVKPRHGEKLSKVRLCFFLPACVYALIKICLLTECTFFSIGSRVTSY